MQKTGKKLFLFIIFTVLGVVIAVQFRSTLYANKQKASSSLDAERLIARLNDEQQLREEFRTEIENNIQKRESYLQAFLSDKDDGRLREDWERIRLIAGLTDVKGPGIVMKLDDAIARQNVDPSALIIHDQDIRIILNELKKAGAQAISINGERIVAMSEQVCAGPTIMINKNRYPVPYVINAIGDPDILYESLYASERISYMLEDQIRIDITKSQEVTIPRYSRSDDVDSFISHLEVVDNENK
jgi:uncharacterized protein YlxW (UPF0749 family)